MNILNEEKKYCDFSLIEMFKTIRDTFVLEKKFNDCSIDENYSTNEL